MQRRHLTAGSGGSGESTDFPAEAEQWAAEEVLRHMIDRFHPRLYVASSFQKEASVIIDMALQINPETRFFTLDTGLLFEETYATWEALEKHYNIRFDVFRGLTLDEQAKQHGDKLWKSDPDRCCGIRKIAPLGRALEGVDAWVTGLRREQSRTRSSTGKVHWDGVHGIWKANPLVDWPERDVFDYLAAHAVPYNELHNRGYASIGCTHCTRPGSGREGRWTGTERTECGIHG